MSYFYTQGCQKACTLETTKPALEASKSSSGSLEKSKTGYAGLETSKTDSTSPDMIASTTTRVKIIMLMQVVQNRSEQCCAAPREQYC